jgi:hypothetical protein
MLEVAVEAKAADVKALLKRIKKAAPDATVREAKNCSAPCCGHHSRMLCFACQHLTTNLAPRNVARVCHFDHEFAAFRSILREGPFSQGAS